MASKHKTALPETERPKPLRVGSRVRCTDDGVQGRITWANATVLKIAWDDGEQVTWRRDSLADRPLEILDPPDDEPATPPDQSVLAPAPQPATEQATAEPPVVAPALAAQAPASEPRAGEAAPQPGEPGQAPAPEASAAQAPADQQAEEWPLGGEAAPAAEQAEAAEPAKETKPKARGQQQKRSALDAAAQVLAAASAPLNCQELIAAMAAQGLWSSPDGKTPAATLYSAILREVQTRGEQARFVKADRGKFALRTAVAPA
jgi:hypothetical protein